jgi:hypothetical protein
MYCMSKIIKSLLLILLTINLNTMNAQNNATANEPLNAP